MRGDELLDILEYIDPALIENTDRKPKPNWIRWTALAASLSLIIGLCLSFLRPPAATIPVERPAELPSLIDYTISPEALSGVQILGDPGFNTSAGISNGPPAFTFATNLVVQAKIVALLPDTYTDPLTNKAYHILRLQTLDVIVGQNIPQEFYLRLPSHLSAELDRFDSLILSMEQVGIENYMLVNQTARTMEAFTLLFEVYNYYSPHYGSVVAFTDGVVDVSLWDLERWGIGDYYVQMILDGDSYLHFPATKGSTPADTKATILEWVGDSERLRNLKVETQADFPEHTVMDYVEPFENGVFAHTYYQNNCVRYYRLINGFMTTERILIDQGQVTYEGEAFTQEDLSALPDIGSVIAELNLDALAPPHMVLYEDMDVRLFRQGASGKYAKVDGQVYGIVKVTWQYLQNDIYDATISYYDALYYLVSADGSYRTVEREELIPLLGEDPLILDPEYGVPIEDPVE